MIRTKKLCCEQKLKRNHCFYTVAGFDTGFFARGGRGEEILVSDSISGIVLSVSCVCDLVF